ncbi:uncharacterized membrane protein YcaP (DUF421 family) [Pedobacter sp. W3I1]|uniref:DUF421 domain-containing protein n=1 Tax=Pedobacter sp. W3I1 TaxID=3042291 RepID=UPI002786A2E5|nr:YetF domain-containing protein [Pedobacter sp. W3I1]MDQ0637822.1 uncharacterized membrane protein YcaP (DUF421 family) [Pedobacter sp. W3I1]
MNFHNLIGRESDLTAMQMAVRGVLVFIVAYLLIRISGRRSFGMKSPVDNIIVILLGAILSRAAVGASPFIPVVVTCLVIVVIHRILSWLISIHPTFGKLAEGEKILLYENGNFREVKLKRALISKAEIMQQIRTILHSENLEKVDKIFMERDGKISIILKPNA